MKKIYITVTEFIENGGELKEGRLLFCSISGGYYCTFLNATDAKDIAGNNMLWVADGDREAFQTPVGIYVEIDCQPIYK